MLLKSFAMRMGMAGLIGLACLSGPFYQQCPGTWGLMYGALFSQSYVASGGGGGAPSAQVKTAMARVKGDEASWQQNAQTTYDTLLKNESLKEIVGDKNITIKVDMNTSKESSLTEYKNTATGESTYTIKISPWQTETSYRLNPNDPWIPAHKGDADYPITLERLIVHEIYHIQYPGQDNENLVDKATNNFMKNYGDGEPAEIVAPPVP